MKLIKLLGMFFLVVSISFGCDMGAEYEGDEEQVFENEGVDMGDWDRERTADFVRTTYSSNRLEVELGQIAKERAKRVEVQDFAQKMIDDHSTANEQLMEIAAQKDFNIAEGLIEDHREQLNDFQEKFQEGDQDNFDEEYVELVENLHEDAVDKLEDAADNVTDMELKSWINTTLPNMRNHLERVEELKDQIDTGIF